MQSLLKSLIQKNNSKIILIVLDGLGGLPVDGKTELESANTPNLDALAQESACGIHLPVGIGITSGSGPGHFGIFGYNPINYPIGRGILEAFGLDMDVQKTDIAARCNYATIKNGLLIDRRAGRISTKQSKKLTLKLQQEISEIDGVKILFAPGIEHRFAVLFRFQSQLPLDADLISDTDPQEEGKASLNPQPNSHNAKVVVTIIEKFIQQVAAILKDDYPANYILMRGFAAMPDLPSFQDTFGLKAIAIATYPMYRGLAKLVGMYAPTIEGTVEDEIKFLKQHYSENDFFFLHIKKIDSCGEDGDFVGKVKRIEEFDKVLPDIVVLNPDVLIITGDHSTPAKMKTHSWHPVPVLLKSRYVWGKTCSKFSERECLKGELGIISSVNIMSLALANALRLKKFGA